VVKFILEKLAENKPPEYHEIKSSLPTEIFSALSAILLEPCPPGSSAEAVNCLLSLRKFSLAKEIKKLKTQILQLEKAGQTEAIIPLLVELQEKKKLQSELLNQESML
jgi:hypothetical protein